MRFRTWLTIAGILTIPFFLSAEETKTNYFFFGIRFSPIISLSKEYNQTHDMDIGGGVAGGYQHQWFSVYAEFVPSFGFGGEIVGRGGSRESYSTTGLWFSVNVSGKVLGNVNDLAMLIGAGGGVTQFSSSLSGYDGETSWSANVRVGAFKKIKKIGRAGLDLEMRFSGVEFPPNTRKLILAVMNFYWDFTF